MMKSIHNTLMALSGIVLTAFLASCAESYNIKGTSNMSTLDGRMLYLKVLKNNDFSNVDSAMSCTVNSSLPET